MAIAKHHRGKTSKDGLKQLVAADDNDNEVERWFITFGKLTTDVENALKSIQLK
jgi:hypothetical protein